MNVLVINCGSSSLKFSLIETESGRTALIGIAERLGSSGSSLSWKSGDNRDQLSLGDEASHKDALNALKQLLDAKSESLPTIEAVGHRVVHGGEFFSEAVLVDAGVIKKVRSCNSLAPLHNPPNLLGIEEAEKAFVGLAQVAVFDTAFHQTLPQHAYMYPLPYDYYEELGIRRYGFHGTSHRYVCEEAARVLGKPLEELNLISVHLGNGCSAAAVSGGRSVDTTMGLTPLEGLVMGTRCGDLDPSIHGFLAREKGMTIEEIDSVLNRKSGLLGLSQKSNDMREIRQLAEEGDAQAELALSVFVFRLAKAIGALRVSLKGLDALIFTGGIGENDFKTRAATLERLAYLGLDLDEEVNAIGKQQITKSSSSATGLVINTNEELMIAKETSVVLGRD